MKESYVFDEQGHSEHLESVGSSVDQIPELSREGMPDQMRESKVIEFRTDELTALCPFDFGGPDFYALTLRYQPKDRYLESKSFKKFVESYRGRKITVEDLASEIYAIVCGEIEPGSCYLCLEQKRRGGIEETVEVGNTDLSDNE